MRINSNNANPYIREESPPLSNERASIENQSPSLFSYLSDLTFNRSEEALKNILADTKNAKSTSDALINWWSEFEGDHNLTGNFFSDPQNNSILNFFLSAMVNIQENASKSILKSVFGEKLELAPEKFKDFINELSLNPAAKMALFAQYIEYKKLHIADFEYLLLPDEWEELTPHLRYADLQAMPVDKVHKILLECKQLTTINVSATLITELPDLPNCINLVCHYCERLSQLPSLPNCKKLDCSRCPLLAKFPDLKNCIELICTKCSLLAELPFLPNCTELNCSECILLIELPPLSNCKKLDCNSCPLLTKLLDLLSCTHLNCANCPLLATISPLPQCRVLNVEDCPSLENLPEVPRSAQVYSGSSSAGDFAKLVVDVEDFKMRPLMILEKLGTFLLNNQPFPNIYYNSDGKFLEAVDIGGVRRDFITNLCENIFKHFDSDIFKGAEKAQFLRIKDGVPQLCNSGEKESYETLGIIFALCAFEDSYFKTGPLFSEGVYTALASLPLEDKELDEWYIDTYVYLQDFLVKDLLTLINLPESADPKDVPIIDANSLNTLGWIIDIENGPVDGLPNFSLSETRAQLRTSLLESAKADPRLKAIECLGQAMKSYFMEEDELLQIQDSTIFKNRIEGFCNAQVLKNHLVWKSITITTHDNVVKTVEEKDLIKTQKFLNNWIDKVAVEEEIQNEKIKDEDVKDTKLQLFIRAITGCKALSAEKLKMHVFNNDEHFVPKSHTCFFSLELSGNYPSQEYFDAKLELFLQEAFAGGGFQIS